MYTYHTPYVLNWINEIVNHPSPLTAKQREFMDDLKSTIESGKFDVSLHPMGRAELLIESVEPWLQYWEAGNGYEPNVFDPELERLIEDFRMQEEFSRFERLPFYGTCTRCGQKNRDVNRSFSGETGEGEKGICHYGCDDLRSQPPTIEAADKGSDYWKWGFNQPTESE